MHVIGPLYDKVTCTSLHKNLSEQLAGKTAGDNGLGYLGKDLKYK